MRHRLSLVTIVVLLATLVAAPAVLAASSSPRTAPKVVLIVGPVGDTTAEYRSLADEAATAAAEFTPNVVKVYSPDATWPVVRDALQGASVVVYLGHGNGWPSPYRKALYPPSQNGFGLNPIADGGDDAHQYFGEDRIATEVRLAPNAIVILSRLCYASGNSEPGLPEGTPADAQQRVDNYAAGFIAAGAAAVIAEAHAGPAWYVRQVLSGRGSVERLWRSAPTANHHVTRFESSRSPGFVGLLDPDGKNAGFYRSIVLRSGLVTGVVHGQVKPVTPTRTEPTLVGLGLTLGAPALIGRPTVGTHARLKLHYSIDGPGELPDGLRIGIRWDPLDPPDWTVEPAGTQESALVARERLGSIVEPVEATVGKSTLAVPVKIPAVRGRYRIVVTLHDAGGDAYDAASQQLLRQAVIRVTGAIDAMVDVEPEFTAVASSPIELPVNVTNLGVARWGREAPIGPRPRSGEGAGAQSALLVARWVPLDPQLSLLQFVNLLPRNDESVRLPAGLEPWVKAGVSIGTVAPPAPGHYLLLLDVVTPADGSLAALGIQPTLIRVTVTNPLH
jgi:hypothetical protein